MKTTKLDLNVNNTLAKTNQNTDRSSNYNSNMSI